jgi:hypothetical protein
LHECSSFLGRPFFAGFFCDTVPFLLVFKLTLLALLTVIVFVSAGVGLSLFRIKTYNGIMAMITTLVRKNGSPVNIFRHADA